MENEKSAITKVQKLREDIEKINADISKAEREYDLNKAAELKYGKLPQLQRELEEEEKIAEKAKTGDSLLRDKVTDEEIARIICRWTGIPVSKLMEGERDKLLHLEDVLHKRVIGQDEAVKKVSEALFVQEQVYRIQTDLLVLFSFLVLPELVKLNLLKLLLNRYLTMNIISFVLI